MGQVWYLIVSIPDLCTLTYLNRERLQAPWRALAFRDRALDSTPRAHIVKDALALQ